MNAIVSLKFMRNEMSCILLQLAVLDELDRIELALAKNREKQVISVTNI